MGHSEAASGMCSVTKVIIAMEHGFIPPNLHFFNPRENMEGLLAGRFKVSDIRLTGGNV
jgi:fatty acid synthase